SVSGRVALVLLFAAVFFLFTDSALARGQQTAPPRILLDQPLRAVEYQLNRLTNGELAAVERRDDDTKYRPVYMALLTRRGLPRQYRDEALAALKKLDRATGTRVLLEALSKVPVEDDAT